jgi:hypothetical protein
MPGVPRELAEHKLKIYPQARPIRQKLRRFTPDKRETIRAELARLVAARFIREVLHPEWLANPVLVLKKNKVDWRMLLGFIVSHRGIEANPEKIQAIMRMEAPRSQKNVQRLTGCMAALSRFISRLGEKGLPFYKLLKKVDKFQWTSEAQEALDALKKFLTTSPVLKPPRQATSTQPTEDLLLYISCTTHVVSTALVVERAEEGHAYPVQHPVYFISEVLGPSKKKYPQVQKLLYAVLLTARKLRHYFDDHKVIVVTSFPIGDLIHNKEAIGRIAKWACKLGSHDIEFRPRTAIKTQALVDFVSEWTEQQVPDNPETAEVWRMYFDGSLKLQGAGAGILFIASGGEQLKCWVYASSPKVL